MRALDKKLWRELWNLRMQVFAIAIVIVGGVSIFIMSLSTLDSLFETRATLLQRKSLRPGFRITQARTAVAGQTHRSHSGRR